MYKLRTNNSCGPDGLGFAVGNFNPKFGLDPRLNQAQIVNNSERIQKLVDLAWGIQDIKKFFNLGDTPLNAFSALEKMKVPHEIISFRDILSGRAIKGQTLILIHNIGKDAEVRSIFTEMAKFIRTNLEEDWIVFESLVRIGDTVQVRCFFGDGTIKQMRSETLDKMMNSGIVRCAYVVGRGSHKVSFWAKLWGRITGKFY